MILLWPDRRNLQLKKFPPLPWTELWPKLKPKTNDKQYNTKPKSLLCKRLGRLEKWVWGVNSQMVKLTLTLGSETSLTGISRRTTRTHDGTGNTILQYFRACRDVVRLWIGCHFCQGRTVKDCYEGSEGPHLIRTDIYSNRVYWIYIEIGTLLCKTGI